MKLVDWQSVYSPTPRDELEKLKAWCAELAGDSTLPLAIEIGSYQGGSTALLACFFDVVVCIDPWGEHETKPGERIASFSGGRGGNVHFKAFMQNIERLEIADRVVPIVGTADFLKLLSFRPFPNLIFVDGSHTYSEVKRDLEVAYVAIDPQGIVVVHDYRRIGQDGPGDPYIGVREAVDEAVEKNLFTIHDKYSGIIALRRSHEDLSRA